MVVSYFELKASHFFPPETEQHFISLLLNCGVYQPMWPSEKKKHNLFSLPNHVILAKATAKLKICVPQQIFFFLQNRFKRHWFTNVSSDNHPVM
jgi:hypothetical protein